MLACGQRQRTVPAPQHGLEWPFLTGHFPHDYRHRWQLVLALRQRQQLVLIVLTTPSTRLYSLESSCCKANRYRFGHECTCKTLTNVNSHDSWDHPKREVVKTPGTNRRSCSPVSSRCDCLSLVRYPPAVAEARRKPAVKRRWCRAIRCGVRHMSR